MLNAKNCDEAHMNLFQMARQEISVQSEHSVLLAPSSLPTVQLVTTQTMKGHQLVMTARLGTSAPGAR